MSRNVPGIQVPSVRSASEAGRVNVPGLAGGVWWPLFDRQTIAAAGISSQRFFAVPKGQGGKTATDTNMELASSIPAGQRFMMTGISVEFYPGEDITQSGATADANQFVNDIYAFYKTGRLQLTIGSKDFVDHGPLMIFPPLQRLDVALDSSTTVASTNNEGAYGAPVGMGYATVQTELVANQNFSVTLHDLPALPSGVDAQAYVRLHGWLYRNAQ